MLKKVLLATGAIAVIAVPTGALAAGEGSPAKGGARNPSPDSRKAYNRETQIIANVDTYGTRQSNKSDNGGGAVYGCRSKAGGTAAHNEPCLRATNLNVGSAFEFATNGVLGGLITVGKGGDTAKPFTTNATGVATGLNADRVDGRDGTDLLGKTEKAADSAKLDGKDSTAFAAAGSLQMAVVNAVGAVQSSSPSGVTASASGQTYTVTFPSDVSKCSYTATERGATASGVTFAATTGGGRDVVVNESGGTPTAFQLQVIC